MLVRGAARIRVRSHRPISVASPRRSASRPVQGRTGDTANRDRRVLKAARPLFRGATANPARVLLDLGQSRIQGRMRPSATRAMVSRACPSGWIVNRSCGSSTMRPIERPSRSVRSQALRPQAVSSAAGVMVMSISRPLRARPYTFSEERGGADGERRGCSFGDPMRHGAGRF